MVRKPDVDLMPIKKEISNLKTIIVFSAQLRGLVKDKNDDDYTLLQILI